MIVKRTIKVWMNESILGGIWKGEGFLKAEWHTFEGWFLFGIIPIIIREM